MPDITPLDAAILSILLVGVVRGLFIGMVREVFSLAPLLVLCVVLGVFPWYLLDWMDTSVVQLVRMLGG